MESNDTISLLKECDAGTKMAISSIDEVMSFTVDTKLKDLLSKSKEHHEKLGLEIHSLLVSCHAEEQEPSSIAKGMSWLKTNFKIAMDESDSTIADLITDGCNMGIKSLHKYLNQYQNADKSSINLCNRLLSIEEKLCQDIQCYL